MPSKPDSELNPVMHSIAEIRTIARDLDVTHTLHDHANNHRLAAVLVLVYPGVNGLEILLTKRADHLPTHAGQISFPGGSIDASDPDPVYTALREAREEVGLDTDHVEVLGILEVDLLPSGFAVAPILAVTESRPSLVPNPEEVDEIFALPLSLASNLDAYGTDWLERDGVRRDFFTLVFRDYYIWGATARMLRSLALLLAKNT